MSVSELPDEIILPNPTTQKEIDLYRAISEAYRNIAQAIAALNAVAPLRVQEIDGTPLVNNVTTIKVTNGRLTNDGAGVITLDIS